LANVPIHPRVTRVAFIESTSRVGRSQGASIFWGLVSVFFAAAACFYFWKSHENESSTNKLRDEVLSLQDERDALNAEKDKLQASMSDSVGQMKTREEFLDEKETKLATEETRLEALSQKPQTPTQSNSSSIPTPKKFADALHKLGQADGADVVTRGGRPVLRIPNASFFAPGDATLKPDGQALLTQLATALNSQSDNFELRVESFTDTDMEVQSPADAKPDSGDKKDKSAKPAPADAASKAHYANSWELTAARAVAIERFFRDQTSLPFQNLLIIARGDSQPITSIAKNHARNSRLEITVTPVPATFHSTDTTHSSTDTSTNSLTPPPEPPAPAKAKPNSP